MLTLQKPVRILKKRFNRLIQGKFYKNSPNFMRLGWVTKELQN